MARASVIIAAYDAERHVAAAIASVQRQTEQDFEILVIDDASEDGTAAVVAAMAEQDRRIRLLRNAVNGGPGTARNLGLAVARGEWIALLDADDGFEPDRLARLITLGDETRADAASDNPLVCREDSQEGEPMIPDAVLSEPRMITAVEYVLGNIGRRNKPRQSYGFMKPIVRRAFLTKHGIRFRPLRFSEDYLFAMDCLIRGARWVVTPEPLYRYTVRPGSLTESHSLADYRRLISACREMLAGMSPWIDSELKQAMRRHMSSVERAHSWRRFAEALKGRKFSDALFSMTADKQTFMHITKEAAIAVPRVVARLTRSN